MVGRGEDRIEELWVGENLRATLILEGEYLKNSIFTSRLDNMAASKLERQLDVYTVNVIANINYVIIKTNSDLYYNYPAK